MYQNLYNFPKISPKYTSVFCILLCQSNAPYASTVVCYFLEVAKLLTQKYDFTTPLLITVTNYLLEIDTLHTILFTAYKIDKKRYSFLISDENVFKKIQLEHVLNMTTIKSKTGSHSRLQIKYRIYTFVLRLATCTNIRMPLSLRERTVFTCVRTFTCSYT